VTLTQLAAVVGPLVLLVTLGVRAALWRARVDQRLIEYDQALHDIGTALNPPSHHGEDHVEDR
jgi:hypothetical protein